MSVTMDRISHAFGKVLKDPPKGWDLDDIQDAIVIGSGYGGAISASRLVEMGLTPMLLERGREILPGEYPTNLEEARRETQLTLRQRGRITTNNGLMDVRVNDDMHVVVGCGLGGTSLLNANVALRADPAVFQQTDADGQLLWPRKFSKGDFLGEAYDEAEKGLGTTKIPKDVTLPKMEALNVAAKALGRKLKRAPINVTFEEGANFFGNYQAACTMCGDCCSGCNFGAKNTTLMNYLPHAQANGARIVTEAVVHWVSVDDGLWTVHVAPWGDDHITEIRTKLLVIAAGTLGSTELLQRSALKGLPLSAANLGRGFSGNGDILGFGFDANYTHKTGTNAKAKPIYSVGAGAHQKDLIGSGGNGDLAKFKPGPCITGYIEIDQGDPINGLVIEDGVAPGPLSTVYPPLFFLQDATTADLMAFPDAARRLPSLAELGTGVQNHLGADALTYEGAVSQTQSYLVMSHDDGSGWLRHDTDLDIVYVDWPGVGQRFPYPRDNEILEKAASAIWGNYLSNPVWSGQFGWNLVTVHPVGGCRMADSAADGVVDGECRLYNGTKDHVYENALVCDGSVIPTSLGLNPLLTISAVTIQAMDALKERRGFGEKRDLKYAESSYPASGAPSKPEDDPFAAMIAQLISAKAAIERAIIGMGVDPEKVREFIKTQANAFIDSSNMNLWQKGMAETAIDGAIQNADLVKDVPGACRTLLDYIQSLLDALGTEGSASDQTRATRALEALRKIIGNVSAGASFDEQMRGSVAPVIHKNQTIGDRYAVGRRQGEADGTWIEAQLHVATPNAADMIDDKNKQFAAKLSGKIAITGDAPIAGTHKVANGTFNLLKNDAKAVELWEMDYQCDLTDTLKFEGRKTLQKRPGSHWWTDLTHLFTTITDTSQNPPVVYEGRIDLNLQDFLTEPGSVETPFKADPNEGAQELGMQLADALSSHDFSKLVADQKWLSGLFHYVLANYGNGPDGKPLAAVSALGLMTAMPLAQRIPMQVFRTYGGLAAYLNNFPAIDQPSEPNDAFPSAVDGKIIFEGIIGEVITEEAEPHYPIRLTRFKGGDYGPVIISSGLGVRALSFGLKTNESSILKELIKARYDVWVFDHRSSPANQLPKKPDYAVDNIALYDWPWAIDTVTTKTGKPTVQIMAHCLGALTVMMSLAAKPTSKVRQLVINQFSLHPVTNWFNQLKADTNMAELIHDGLPETWRMVLDSITNNPELGTLLAPHPTFDLSTQPPDLSGGNTTDMTIDALLYGIPFPDDNPCLSPTCHRVFGVFGPVWLHKNLNEATHNVLGLTCGTVATYQFEQLGLIMKLGRAVDKDGNDTYLRSAKGLDMPIHFMAGSDNQLVMPETTLRTQRWLQQALPHSAHKFTREVFGGYGHLDCFFGQNAHQDIYGAILGALEQFKDG
ncbi:GMC family oxidoreductase N-terminal domain-containing protein [Yoonia litorea]|uniref:Cholesterol oxidase n=1 Tax=Yoonia litorea TaxID=1123755 RepID=A0A1I6MI31_9RHOB|nr:GMC family oxidoreductase N-terminal domain-containing protein [Yoonia litorea]SFS15267.1 Choline dehydrogenase [Yoonia litorea]